MFRRRLCTEPGSDQVGSVLVLGAEVVQVGPIQMFGPKQNYSSKHMDRTSTDPGSEQLRRLNRLLENSMIWVITACQDLSVRKQRINNTAVRHVFCVLLFSWGFFSLSTVRFCQPGLSITKQVLGKPPRPGKVYQCLGPILLPVTDNLLFVNQEGKNHHERMCCT